MSRIKPNAPAVAVIASMIAIAMIGSGCGLSRNMNRSGTSPSSSSGQHPLHAARVMAFAATREPTACRAFYENTLGLRVIADDAMALMLESEGTIIRIQKVPQHQPVQFTVLGWNVSDIRATASKLSAAGVTIERFEWMEMQDDSGIATFSSGDMVAWFKDPDGNVLSIAQLKQ